MAKEQEGTNESKGQQPKKATVMNIVRISGRDINGDLDIPNALRQIKGIGYNLAHAISLGIESQFGISSETKIGSLEEDKMLQVESVIKDPRKANVPQFLFNRKKDNETGTDTHLVGTDLIVRTRQDIDNDIKIQSYRGFRHRYGQKVRGQRTRSTGRTGATIGVTKAKVEAAAKPAPKAAPGAGSSASKPAAGS